MSRPQYPFAAIVGQDEMKLALILTVISPQVSGVLIRGDKGTAKSTAVRGLAELLPERAEAAGTPYHLSPGEYREYREELDLPEAEPETRRTRVPVVELPVGATEDRVAGTLDLETALTAGRKRFEPGLLAAAHRGILYVDEVNLLDDHVVDLLLDSAAMGVNTVEREGISLTHPARFSLVGTMNPEEGELRPQLLDRFGLCVTVTGETDPDARVQIIERRLAFEADPAGSPASGAARATSWRSRSHRPLTCCRRSRPATGCCGRSHRPAWKPASTATAPTSPWSGQPAPWPPGMPGRRSSPTTSARQPTWSYPTACAATPWKPSGRSSRGEGPREPAEVVRDRGNGKSSWRR